MLPIYYYFSFSGLVAAVASLALGLFVYYYNKKSEVNRRYMFLSLAAFVWGVGYIFWPLAQNNKTECLYWFRVLHMGAIFLPICFLDFAFAFLNIKNKLYRKIGYSLAIFFCALCFSPFFIRDMRPVSIFKYWGVPGIFYYPYLVYFGLCSVYGAWILWQAYGKSKGMRKNQILYVLIGLSVTYFCGATNFLLFFKFPIPPYLNIFCVTYNILFAYAIVRHKLMNVEVVIKRTMVFAGLLTFVFFVLIFPTLLMQEQVFRNAGFGGKMIGLAISGVIIILTMRRIENFLTNITDKFLFQKKYSYKELLKAFTSEVLTVLDMDRLLDLTTNKLKEIIKLDTCSVEMTNDKYAKYPPPASGAVELAVPMEINNKRIGTLFLGKKKSDELYTKDDLDILLPLSKTLAIAISNAKLFEELSTAQAEAAQKEKMATIGTLAAGMAHEIRNPITTIRTFADYLPECYKDSDFIDKFNRLIPKEIDRVDNIAKALLEFSSTEGEDAEEFDVKETLWAVLSLLEPQYKFTDIKILMSEDGSYVIYKHKNQLQEALLNIMKYILSETMKDTTIYIETVKNSNDLSILFKDKLLVVSDSIIKDVFEPASKFQKTKRGFGFGLFIAKEMIEKNDGVFSISSGQNGGAEFRIELKNAFVPA